MKRRVLLTLFVLAFPLLAQEAKEEEKPVQTAQLARPEPNVEFTVYMLAGLAQASQQESLPNQLDSVAMQLRSLFTYQDYRLLDTIVLRARNGGRARVDGSMAAPVGSETANYWVEFQRIQVLEDAKTRMITVQGLSVGVSVGGSKEKPYRLLARFSTSIDVREGQKVVVGKANVDGTGNALILVVTAKAIE